LGERKVTSVCGTLIRAKPFTGWPDVQNINLRKTSREHRGANTLSNYGRYYFRNEQVSALLLKNQIWPRFTADKETGS
jgi:hypothetical protein